MKKGDIYEGVITGYDFPNKASLKLPKEDGSGDFTKVTIKGALPGQKVRFMITKKKSGMAEGRVLELLEKSPFEDGEELCPYFGLCGGCAYQSMSYENQLKLKEDAVKKLLMPYLGEGSGRGSGQCCDTVENADKSSVDKDLSGTDESFIDTVEENVIWEGILPAPLRFDYRNKMEFTFGDEYKDGPLALGLHKKGGHYDILHVSECRIINSDWGKIISFTQEFFREKKVPFYHKMRHEGILRNLVVRQSKASGEFLINLVATTQWEKYGFEETADVGNNGVVSSMEGAASIGENEGEIRKNEDKNLGSEGCLNRVLKEYAAGILDLEKSSEFKGSIAGILYTENDSLGDVVQSDRTYTLYGRDFIEEEILGLRFKISPFSFFQTNSKGCEVLYDKAREYIIGCSKGELYTSDDRTNMTESARNTASQSKGGQECLDEALTADGTRTKTDFNGKLNGKVVFDLYSGTGTIAQMMAPAAKKVIGIEIVEEAVEAAKENAKLNGLDNCEFIAGDVLKAIDLVRDKPDLIILDPPRDGVNPRALEKILAFNVDEMVYISCKPTSLARDLEVITSKGYRVVKACAADEFPATVHVETVVLMSRVK